MTDHQRKEAEEEVRRELGDESWAGLNTYLDRAIALAVRLTVENKFLCDKKGIPLHSLPAEMEVERLRELAEELTAENARLRGVEKRPTHPQPKETT